MALPPSYQARTQPQTARLPGVDPEAYGVGLARDAGAAAGALHRAGQERDEAAHRVALIDRQRGLRAKFADRGAALATLGAALREEIATARSTAAPGAAGHEEAVKALVQQRADAFMATLDEPELVDAFLPDVAALSGTLGAGETAWAIGQRADKQVNDFEATKNTLANTLFTDPSDAALQQSIALWDKMVDAAALPGDAKAALKRAGAKDMRIRAWQGVAERNPQGALDLVDGGYLNGVAEDQEIVALRNSAQAGVDRIAAQARAAQSAQLESFREGARSAIEDVNEGVAFDPATLDAWRAQAETADETDLARDLGVASAQAKVMGRYAGSNVAELEAARREIEQSGDWRGSRELVAAHGALTTMIGRTRDRARGDKLGLWSENGGRLTPFDPADPGAVRGRVEDMRAATKRYGGTDQLLTEAEAEPLRDAFAKGSATDKARLIAAIAPHGNDATRAFLRAIAPAEARYAVLADLATMRDRQAGQTLAREALAGWEQIAANPKLIDAADMQAETQRIFGAPLMAMGGQLRAGIFNVATGIYANRAATANVRGFDRDLWLSSFAAALGGGLGAARGGARFVLPRGATQDDWDRALARADGAAIMAAAAGDAPLWSGKPMTPAAFKGLIPVLFSDDNNRAFYKFRTREGGFARSQRNPALDFVLDARKLGGARP